MTEMIVYWPRRSDTVGGVLSRKASAPNAWRSGQTCRACSVSNPIRCRLLGCCGLYATDKAQEMCYQRREGLASSLHFMPCDGTRNRYTFTLSVPAAFEGTRCSVGRRGRGRGAGKGGAPPRRGPHAGIDGSSRDVAPDRASQSKCSRYLSSRRGCRWTWLSSPGDRCDRFRWTRARSSLEQAIAGGLVEDLSRLCEAEVSGPALQ